MLVQDTVRKPRGAMMNLRNWVFVPAAFAPLPALAQQAAVSEQFSQTLLTIAILLGLGASVYVFVLSFRLGGGAIAASLALYGAGMISVVVSLLSVTWWKPLIGAYAGLLHDGFFIIGFILMMVGSHKVARVLR